MSDYVNNNETNPDPEEAAKAEKEFAWRGAMAESIRAIVSNFADERLRELVDQHPFDALELPNLCIVPVSEFSTDAFHDMLSQLQFFRLSLLGNSSEIPGLNIYTVFNGFAECLGPWFFNHLSSVERLILEPGSDATLGRAGQEYGHDISLRDARMPKLAEIEFRNLFICEELIDFVVRHADTLESVQLEECYAFDSSTCWKDLFAALVRASPARLTSFLVVESRNKEDRLNLHNVHGYSNPDTLARVWAKLEREPDAIAFPYGYVYADDGGVYEDHDDGQARFLQGDDYRTYLELMAIVDANVRACELGQDGHGV